MSNIIRNSIQERKGRIGIDSMLALDHTKQQYVSAGINQNVTNAIDRDRDFAINFIFQMDIVDDNTSYILAAQADEYSAGLTRGWTAMVRRENTDKFFLRFNFFWEGENEWHYYTSPTAFEVGKLYHATFNYYASIKHGVWLVNAVKHAGVSNSVNITTNTPETVQQDNWPLEFAIGRGVSTNPDVFSSARINQLAFFNRLLSEQEILYLHTYGGLVPEIAHAACVAHYVADGAGRTMWDCVEQYNYAKGTALTAQHASLKGYTDAETGIPNVSSQTAYKDFYSKERYNPYLLYSTSGTNGVVTHAGAFEFGLNDFEIEFRFFYEARDGGANIHFFQKREFDNGSVMAIFQGDRFYLRCQDQNGNLGQSATENIFTAGNWYTVKLQKIGYDVNSWKTIINSQEEPVVANYNALTATSEHTNISDIDLTRISGGWRIMMDYWQVSIDGNLVERWEAAYMDDIQILGQNGYHALLQNLDIQDLIEKKSLLPPLENALNFIRTSNHYLSISNFSPTKELGYTFVIAVEGFTNSDVTQPAGLFGKRGGPYIICYYEGNGGEHNLWLRFNSATALKIDAPELEQPGIHFIVFTVFPSDTSYNYKAYVDGRLMVDQTIDETLTGLDEATGIFAIGKDSASSFLTDPTKGFDGNMLMFGVAKGIISRRDQQELLNNTLLRQPFKRWKIDWQLLINFNKIIDNTANVADQYLFEDLSGQGHTIEAVNYTAANADPADPAYSLTKIDDLR